MCSTESDVFHFKWPLEIRTLFQLRFPGFNSHFPQQLYLKLFRLLKQTTWKKTTSMEGNFTSAVKEGHPILFSQPTLCFKWSEICYVLLYMFLFDFIQVFIVFSVIAAVAWLQWFALVAWCCYFYPAQTMATLSVSWSSYDTSPNEKGRSIFCHIVRNSSQINCNFSPSNRFVEEIL